MQSRAQWRRYLRFWRPDPHRDVDDELQGHLESRIADLVESGVAPHEARRQALEEFGDLHETRRRLYEIDRRITRRRERALSVDAVRADLRQVVRGLRRSPLVTATVVLTLALGIGAMATTYGVMRQLVLRPPPHVVDPDRVVRLFFIFAYPGQSLVPGAVTSYDAFEVAREQRDVFANVAALGAMVLVTALVASMAPARRAATIDPVTALRSD